MICLLNGAISISDSFFLFSALFSNLISFFVLGNNDEFSLSFFWYLYRVYIHNSLLQNEHLITNISTINSRPTIMFMSFYFCNLLIFNVSRIKYHLIFTPAISTPISTTIISLICL